MTSPAPASSLRLAVRSLVTRPPVTCAPGTTIAAASRTMAAEGVGSILVVDAGGRLDGIVTDRDLRERVLAAGRAPETRVDDVMSSPVVALSPEALVFEALLEMTRRGIHHLGLVEAGRLIGVLSSHDLLLVQASAPLDLTRALEACTSLAELERQVPRLPGVVRQLFDQGASGYELGRVAAEVNDVTIRRVLAIVGHDLAEEQGPPPAAFAWLALGSEGRREQTLHTDQDNALVYEDVAPAQEARARRWFTALSERAIRGLVQLGYPPCPAGAMASNPRWCQPLAVWRRYFTEWIRDTTTEHLMYSSIYLDFRAVDGARRLADALRAEIREQTRAWRSFARYLAKIAVSHGPPLGLFGRFLVRRHDGRRGMNLKLGGILLLNNALRAYAIDLGLPETNTIERLEAARRAGCFTAGEAEDVRQAYETIFRIRLRHQLDRLEAGQAPDNIVDPRELARTEQDALRRAFRSIERLQGTVETRYLTEML